MSQRTNLAGIAESIIGRFDRANGVRDRALTEGRQIVRLSANAVRAVHRAELADADRLLDDAGDRIETLRTALAPHPALYWAGYVQDAMTEYAEARITAAVVRGETIPDPGTLGVEDAAYLNALAEAASELRRQVLDRLRADDLPNAERLLTTMDEIYDLLVTIDFPDAITGGLRRTTDQLRAVLERTRGDLTVTLQQRRLEHALREAQHGLAGRTHGT